MAIFPLLVAEPPPGEQDPEDQEDEEDSSDDNEENDNPKHCASQVGVQKLQHRLHHSLQHSSLFFFF